MTEQQIDLFEPDPDLVERLAEVAFNAAVRAVLAEQAKGIQ